MITTVPHWPRLCPLGFFCLISLFSFAICAIYGKPFLTAASDAWELMRSRGFDAVINDSLIGGVLAFAQIIAGLVTGIAAALIAYYGFDTDWRAWAGAGFIIGVMLMVVVTEVVEAAVITLFIWSVRQREGEWPGRRAAVADYCCPAIAADLSPAPLVFVFSHPASPTIPACCSAPSPSPTAGSWTRSTKITPLADTRTSTAAESEGLTPHVTIDSRYSPPHNERSTRWVLPTSAAHTSGYL